MDAEQPEGEPTSRRLFRMAVVFVITTLLLMTQGFGTFPANEISSALAQTVTANLPAPLIDALDGYLDVLGVPALSAVASNFSTGEAQAKVDNKENVVPAIFASHTSRVV